MFQWRGLGGGGRGGEREGVVTTDWRCRPRDKLACCWDVQQATHNNTRVV